MVQRTTIVVFAKWDLEVTQIQIRTLYDKNVLRLMLLRSPRKIGGAQAQARS